MSQMGKRGAETPAILGRRLVYFPRPLQAVLFYRVEGMVGSRTWLDPKTRLQHHCLASANNNAELPQYRYVVLLYS